MKHRSKQALCCMLSAALMLTAAAIPATALPASRQVSTAADTARQDGYSTEIGNIRVQTLSDTLARVEVKGPEGFEDRETYHITGRDWEGVSAQVTAAAGETLVITDYYTVHVPDGADSLEGIYITDAAGKTIWTYTELPENNQYLPDPGNTPAAWAIADNPRVVPAEWGYDYLPEGEEDNGYNGWDADNNAPDMYIFMPRGSAKQLRQDFVDLTGSSELVPLKALGLWHSCFYAYSEETALAEMQKYRDEGFPLDNFVMDTDWRMGGSHGYDINTSLFPDMERFLDRAHEEQNVRVIFNDHPESQDGQHVLEQDELNYRNDNLRRLLNMGLDTWWFDRNWTVSLVSPFDGIPKESIGMYLYQDITSRVTPEERPLILGNVDGITSGVMEYAPNLSSHRYSIQWTGDIMQTDTALKQEIVAAVRSGAITGVPYVSADVGGHYGVNSPEQWTRWSQYAAFSPIFRYHSVGGDVNRAPWLYGDAAEDTAREYVLMRYRLMPVFYAAAHKNYETGLPITQRLDYNYPQYAESQDDTTYTIGDTILVAPIWEAGTREDIPAAWLSHDGQPGLQAAYYNNTNLEGEPVLTRVDDQIAFNWGEGSPDSSVNTNNFSARWTGTLTVGEDDARLAVTSDDGVRIYIDGKIYIDKWAASNNVTNYGPEILEAGSTHDITVEYYEGSGGARINVESVSLDEAGDSREVFIPDGRWIDVWTGETYEGPQTITVTHSLETSPVFVRSGSILPLVSSDVDYVDEKPWDAATLDVYPSTQLDGASELYEDDGTSVGYKEGAYRTTALSTTFDDATGETVVNIGAAEGSYDGSDAFTEREWTVRVHGLSDWGDVTGATVDGEEAQITKIEKTADASPFAISGGALDGDIYEITFTKALDEASEIRVKFATPTDETLPEPADSAVQFTASDREVRSTVDLTSTGAYDWTVYTDTAVSKADGEDSIGQLTVNGTTAAAAEGASTFTWSDGDPTAEGSSKTGTTLSDGSFQLDVAIGDSARRISLYVGADDAVGRVEITGGATASLIEVDGTDTSLQRRIVIDASAADLEGVVHIVYRKTNGDGTISLLAATSGSPDEDALMAVERTAEMTDAANGINLTEEGAKDWVHLGAGGDTGAVNRKANVEPLLSAPTYTGALMSVTDFPTISFSDGTPTASLSNCTNAVTAYQGTISFSVPSTNTWQELKVYMGGYQTQNTIEITDETGSETTRLSFEVGDATQRKVITIRFRSDMDSTLSFKASGTGHLFVAAYTLSDVPGEDILNGAVSRAQAALDGFAAANDTTADDILAAVEEAIADSAVTCAWSEAFTLTPATEEAAGSITGQITLTAGADTAVVSVNLAIPPLEPAGEIVEGDANDDGLVDIQDVMAACRILARKNTGSQPTEEEKERCDLDGNDDVDINDIMLICRILARQA